MQLQTIRSQLAKLRLRPTPWRRKPTTAENRQELDRILAHVANLPADAPRYPVDPDVYRELDEMITMLGYC